MDIFFQQQLESKRNELISLNAAYGGEFRADELHLVVNQIGEIRIGIAYTLSPNKAVYFYAGYGQAIFSKRFATATQAYIFAIRNAKQLINE